MHRRRDRTGHRRRCWALDPWSRRRRTAVNGCRRRRSRRSGGRHHRRSRSQPGGGSLLRANGFGTHGRASAGRRRACERLRRRSGRWRDGPVSGRGRAARADRWPPRRLRLNHRRSPRTSGDTRRGWQSLGSRDRQRLDGRCSAGGRGWRRPALPRWGRDGWSGRLARRRSRSRRRRGDRSGRSRSLCRRGCGLRQPRALQLNARTLRKPAGRRRGNRRALRHRCLTLLDQRGAMQRGGRQRRAEYGA